MVREMRAMERKALRKKLDKEMRNYRLAGREENPTNGLLHAVREALRVPIKEIAEKMGVSPSNVFELEEREETGSITLRSLGRMAEAMGCKVVYGVISANGKTFDAMAEERLWKDVLGSAGTKGVRERGSKEAREQVSESASQRGSEAAGLRGNEGAGEKAA